MKLLLTTLNSKYIHSNLAIRILYQLNKGYEGLDWKEFVIKEDQDEVAKYCSAYEVVAFSCYIWNITQTLAVARKIKNINPKIKILLGGPEVSYEWQDMIAKDEVDYIITGEGEIPFEEFIRDYPNLQNVSSLVRKENNEVYYNPNAPTFLLDRLTDIMPYTDDDVNTLANKVLYIETSRGCPYKCEFCLASLDNKVRYLPDESIKRTLNYMMQYGKVIKFLDRTFNIKKDFTIGMFEYILAHHREGNVFQFEITADIVHPDIIAYIQEHIPPGIFRFEIGIQTVNQKANLEVSRKQNFDKTSAIIKQLDNKIEMHLDLIVGLPLDYYEDIKFSFEEVFKLFAPELQLGFLKFLKGTPVRDKYQQHEYKFDPLPPYQIIESKYLSKEQLNEIVILENALEIYWNRKRAFYTLKYVTSKYSIFDFLQGVGNLFIQKSDFFKHTLEEIYTILYAFAQTHFATDRILQQLIALDYYSYYKVKPKMLFLPSYDKKQVQQQIENLQLNHHKYRYVAIDLDFDFNEFKNEGRMVLNASKVWLQYDGDKQAEIIVPEMQLEN